MDFAPQQSFLAELHLWVVLAAPYVALAALVLAIGALFLLLAIRRRFIRLALGRTGSIEESVTILTRDVKELQTFRIELEQYLKFAELRLRGSLQGYGMVRFNPFAESGGSGNQSFAIAFLDEGHSGVVLSTLYARDRVGVYAKPLENGVSTYELTKEEREAIEKAKVAIAEHKKRKPA